MWPPSKAQIDAVSRHAITAAGIAFTIFGLQAKGITLDSVVTLIKSLGDTANTVVQLVAAIATVYGGIKAFSKSSPASQVAQVQEIATGPASAVSVDAQKALITATSAVAMDKSIPKSDEAKDALVAATIALPEVQTIITDKKTSEASTSPSVIPAEAA